MKSYEEITSQVLETAAVRTVKIKRMRNICTLTVVCACCVIGGAAFMKLDKPEIKPSDLYSEESNDTLHSASDPSTEPVTETTEAPTTETTPEPTTIHEPETETTPVMTTTETSLPEVVIPTEFIPVYVESGAAPIVTNLPGEAHTTAAPKHTTTSVQEAETTSVPVESSSQAETTVATDETEPLTEATVASETTESSEAETLITSETKETETVAEETTEPETSDELPSEELTEPSGESADAQPLLPLDKWQLLYELYFNGELPFNLDSLLPLEDDSEQVSLFPDLFLDESE